MTIEDFLQLDTKILSLFELTQLYYGLKANQEISRFRLERLKIIYLILKDIVDSL